MAQGGDFTLGNGFGGESIYGEKFEVSRLHHSVTGPVHVSKPCRITTIYV